MDRVSETQLQVGENSDLIIFNYYYYSNAFLEKPAINNNDVGPKSDEEQLNQMNYYAS